jgi:hypothetical protein
MVMGIRFRTKQNSSNKSQQLQMIEGRGISINQHVVELLREVESQ